MKTVLKRKNVHPVILTVLIAMLLLLSCNVETEDAETSVTDTSAVADTTATEEKLFVITKDTRIVRPGKDDETEMSYCRYLAEKILENCGVSIKIITDDGISDGNKIIIGECSRYTCSVEFTGGLIGTGYGYSVISENEIVISGSKTDNIDKAVKLFVVDVINGNGEIKAGMIKIKDNEIKLLTYKINGYELPDFTVVCKSAYNSTADILIKLINEKTGLTLERSEQPKEGKNSICIVSGTDDNYGGVRYSIRSEKTDSGYEIKIDSNNAALRDKAVQEFVTNYFTSSDIEIPEVVFGYNFSSSNQISSGLRLSKSVSDKVADGVTYYRLNYTNSENKNVDAYALVVSGNAPVSVEAWAAPMGKTKTVFAQAKEVAAQGKNVLAMTNAGFFRLSTGELTPYGIQIINGEVIQEPSQKGSQYTDKWFGVTKDGKYVISDTAGYNSTYKGNLLYAVGGSRLTMKNRVVQSISTDHLDPRTVVGITDDGGLIILCVDGRTDVSAGSTYVDTAQIMMDLDAGVVDMLNLDGGGSTTLVMKNENGWLQVRNNPCVDPLRPVADTLVIVKK